MATATSTYKPIHNLTGKKIMAYSNSYEVFSEEHDATITITINGTPDSYFVTATNDYTGETIGETEFSTYPSHEDIENALWI